MSAASLQASGVIAAPGCHCGPRMSLRPLDVIAGLTRNPQMPESYARLGAPLGVIAGLTRNPRMPESYARLGAPPDVIAGLTRNPRMPDRGPA